MLLTELFLFETTDFSQLKRAWVRPATGEVVTVPSGWSHINIIAKQPGTFGTSQEAIEQDMRENEDENIDSWADENDFINSKFHLIAYENGWVRWWTDTGGYTWLEAGISGRLPDILRLLSSKLMMDNVKDHFDANSWFAVFLDIIDGNKLDSANGRFMNLGEYNRFLRQLTNKS